MRLQIVASIGALLLAITGCAPIIQPRVSPSEFLVAGNKIPGKIDLFIAESFRSYHVKKIDISELKSWNFELGPVTVDALRFGLESRFENVSVILGDPVFPIDAEEIFFAAVQPSFSRFEASDPLLFRFENYKATVELQISVRNSNGKVMHSQNYVGEGKKQGSVGQADPGHAAYPIAVQDAVKGAVRKFVADLVGLSSRKDMIGINLLNEEP